VPIISLVGGLRIALILLPVRRVFTSAATQYGMQDSCRSISETLALFWRKAEAIWIASQKP
jgi:hypothetical protein